MNFELLMIPLNISEKQKKKLITYKDKKHKEFLTWQKWKMTLSLLKTMKSEHIKFVKTVKLLLLTLKQNVKPTVHSL